MKGQREGGKEGGREGNIERERGREKREREGKRGEREGGRGGRYKEGEGERGILQTRRHGYNEPSLQHYTAYQTLPPKVEKYRNIFTHHSYSNKAISHET